MEKNKEQYAIMETICIMEVGVTTNLCAICDTREDAIEKVKEIKEKHLNSRMDWVTREEYNRHIQRDLDTVFDYFEGDEYEYHLLACKPKYN